MLGVASVESALLRCDPPVLCGIPLALSVDYRVRNAQWGWGGGVNAETAV